MTELLGMPPDLSTHGEVIDQLIFWIHVIMLALGVGWGAFFLYTLVRFRRGRNAQANYEGTKSHASSYLEIGVGVIEAVLLIGFAIPLWAQRIGLESFPDTKDSVEVQVIAQQFQWNMHYPGVDGVFGRLNPTMIHQTLNPIGKDPADPNGADDIVLPQLLVIPENKPVIVHLTSMDVIHSFSLPVLRIKQDTIPGQSIKIWFQATQTSEAFKREEFQAGKWESVNKMPDFQVACAQLCGAQHYKMIGKLVIVTEEEFAGLKTEEDFTNWFVKHVTEWPGPPAKP